MKLRWGFRNFYPLCGDQCLGHVSRQRTGIKSIKTLILGRF